MTAAPAGRPGDAAPLTFAKLHGLGNSYLFVYADRDPADPAAAGLRVVTFTDIAAGEARHLYCNRAVPDAWLARIDQALPR